MQAQRPEKYTFIRHDSLPDVSGLTPDYPLSMRRRWAKDIPEKELRSPGFRCFRTGGGLVWGCMDYIALVAGERVVIDSPEKFRELFAPVETREEAMTFARILTDSYPIYNLDFLMPEPDEYLYFETLEYDGERYDRKSGKWVIWVDSRMDSIKIVKPLEGWHIVQTTPEVESSYVRRVKDGYEVLLYHYQVFGCSHPYSRRIVKVTFDGRAEIVADEKAFFRWEEEGFCVD